MSRLYSMSVEINGYNPKYRRAIETACRKVWTFDDAVSNCAVAKSIKETHLTIGAGDGYLCGGESEEEFTDRLSKAIWKANKGPCIVRVNATYLEELPCENHIRGLSDYKSIMKRKHKCAKR